MVDFKRALLAKKMYIKCDSKKCTDEATCYFEIDEDNEDGPKGSYRLCELCFKNLFPQSDSQVIDECKLKMVGYKYRLCK